MTALLLELSWQPHINDNNVINVFLCNALLKALTSQRTFMSTEPDLSAQISGFSWMSEDGACLPEGQAQAELHPHQRRPSQAEVRPAGPQTETES